MSDSQSQQVNVPVEEAWHPGQEVEIIAHRLRLRSLRATDVPADGVPAWYGDGDRRRHIWSPPIGASQFLRGLADHCDQRSYFALLAFLRANDEPVGLAKGQVLREREEVLFVLTTLLGDRGHESLMLGYEITSAALWFAVNHLPINQISMRIYEDNEKTIELVKAFGYTLHGVVEEKGQGASRRVCDYRKSRDDWIRRYESRFRAWIVRGL